MGKFTKGNPGGPGRPRGSRNALNLILDQLAAGQAEKMVNAAIEEAVKGDAVSRRMVLNRIWSVPKGRPAEIELPAIRTPDNLLAAHSAVTAAITSGSITPQDGAALSSVLAQHHRAFELVAQQREVETLKRDVRRLRSKKS